MLNSEVISNEIDKLRRCYATSVFDSLVVQTKQDVANKKNYPKPKEFVHDADSVREKADENYWQTIA